MINHTKKIDVPKMAEMFRAGKTVQQIAEKFGVTVTSVYAAKKKLRTDVMKNLALENAGRIVNKSLNAVEQLEKVNMVANKLLDELTGEDRLISHMVKAVEDSLDCETDAELRERIKSVVTWVNQDKNTAIKACAEIRNQLKLQLDIFQALYDMKAVEEFQQEVLDVIGEVNPDARNKIVRRLGEKSIIRTAIKFH